MKRVDLIRHLEKNGCHLLREGGKHSIYRNAVNGKLTSIPRHTEIKRFLIIKICKKDLEIPEP